MPPCQAPPAVITSPPKAPTLADAERVVFSALDAGEPLPAPAHPGSGAMAYRWLRTAALWKPGAAAPGNPFPNGTKESDEAEALRRFLVSGSDAARLPLQLSGSRLLLWTWMRSRDRASALPRQEREAIEDRLLADGPAMIQGWALRHALCFAVAERNGARFAALKARYGSRAPATFAGVQAVLGLLDGPSPVFRLWQLPGLRYQDTSLGDLGARSVWICPPGIPVPPGAAWIIPSETGDQDEREAELAPPMKSEAEALAPHLHGRAAWFAASRAEWEAQGFSWFPILVELGAHGNITTVRMGDAAP